MKIKTITKKFLLLFAMFAIVGVVNNTNVYAETQVEKDIITDSNDIRWSYELSTPDEGDTTLSIYFYDKPATLETVTVPSLNELLQLVPNAPRDLDTYFLKNAKTGLQDADFPSYTRREATKVTKKLDMTHTSMIQILGVKPIIDPDTETELVFGENMVISETNEPKIYADVCGRVEWYQWSDFYNCRDYKEQEFDIPGADMMTDEEMAAYVPTPSSINCFIARQTTSAMYDASHCYINWTPTLKNGTTGAFAGYKLKLTNFDGNNFNYVGWKAFANTQIKGQAVTLNNDVWQGSYIFKGSNIKKATINANDIGAGVFMDCDELEEVVFGDSATRVPDDAFVNTNLTSYDFSTTNIKTIGARAFKNAKLKSVNLDGVQRLEYQSFLGNDISGELVLPKSINYLQAEVFKGNKHIVKLTIAYDTLTSGTTLPLFVVFGNTWSEDSNEANASIREVEFIAPYGENDEVSDTHVPYNDYKYRYDARTQEYKPNCPILTPTTCNRNSAVENDYGRMSFTPYNMGLGGYYDGFVSRGSASQLEEDYADVDSKKNIIAPIYLAQFFNIQKITIGEGYEFIGSSAFVNWSRISDYNGGNINLRDFTDSYYYDISLPESLKGIGNSAFDHVMMEPTRITLPKGLEFIGSGAFQADFYVDTDVDFPNLVALGDHAFEKTRARNIHLYDKLKYMGVQVFSDCLYLNDITFDLDVMNPDIYIAWAQPKRSSDSWYDGQFHFTTEFGPRSTYLDLTAAEAERYRIRIADGHPNDFWPLKFGTITFTEKNKTQLPNGYNNCYNAPSCPGGGYGISQYNTLFGHISADKVDISKTAWKVLSPAMFKQTRIDEILLPENLEVIPGDSFSDAFIKEELVIPDTVKVIGDAAFDYGMTLYYNGYGKDYTAKITKLPESLEYIGNDAFWGDYNLTADLNSENLWAVGHRAFQGTRIRDVYLHPSTKVLLGGAFANVSTLRNITIDFDFGALPPNYYMYDPSLMPQSFLDYAGYNMFGMLTASCSAYNMWNGSWKTPVETFYSLFSQDLATNDIRDSNYTIIERLGQLESESHFGKVVFTDKNQSTEFLTNQGFFAGLEFDELDLSATGWKSLTDAPYALAYAKVGKLKLPQGLEIVNEAALEEAEISQPFEMPSTIKTIENSAFQWAKGTASNMFAEGLETIGNGALYGADLGDELTIPSTVTSVGFSAFNAGDEDVHYDLVTVKPDLAYDNDAHQMIHQLFWANDIKEMVIESSELPVTNSVGGIGEEEFYAMPLEKVTLTNVPIITADAFLNNTKLKEVDMSKNANLRVIADEAFLNDEKLHIIKFSPAIKNETVTVGQHAFQGTAFETMGDSSKDFDLTAAKFDASRGLAFAEMPKLRSVDVPNNFSKNTIPVATFHNDSELKEATVDYRIKKMETGAFSNDDKLERIFIWGNTVVEDEKLENYTAPIASAMNARLANVTLDTGEEIDTTDFGPTIPETTDIYAYSVSPTEQYASTDDREDFDSTFYPLDEVLYITSNKPRVVLNDDEDDFDKSNLVVYGLRRDGVILQSNSWGEFDGTVYPRSESNLTFERMAGFQEENPVCGAVYDTPVPLNELDYGNANFETIDFELIRDSENSDVRLVNIIYTDKYTEGKPDTDIDPNAPVDEPTIPEIIEDLIDDLLPETPFTGDHITGYVAGLLAFGAIATIFVLKRRK